MENSPLITGRLLDGLSRIVPKDNDTYTGEDGLLYCRRCNTKRQRWAGVEGLIEPRIVFCLCKCMKEADDQEEARLKEREQRLEINRYRSMGFPDREMLEWTFENMERFDDGATPHITNAMKAYVENFPEMRKSGKGLLLYGNVSTGKSFVAGCVVNALIDKGYPCLMTSIPRMTNQILGMLEGKQEYIDSLSRFSLVAIDDLGTERSNSEYMNEQMTAIIDTLYRAKVPMIITSNYTPKQLTEDCEIQKKRIYERLLERCHPVLVDCPSRRKQIGRKDFAEMNKLLGL